MKKLFILSILALVLATFSVAAATDFTLEDASATDVLILTEDVEELRGLEERIIKIENLKAGFDLENIEISVSGVDNDFVIVATDDGMNVKLNVTNEIVDYKDQLIQNIATITIDATAVNSTDAGDTQAVSEVFTINYEAKTRLVIKEADDEGVSLNVIRYNDDNEDKDDDEEFSLDDETVDANGVSTYSGDVPVDVFPFDIVELEFDIANIFDEDNDFDNVEISYVIEGIENDGDDLEEDDDVEDIDSDDDVSYTIRFEAPYTVESNTKFTVEIEIIAEDEDEADHYAYYEIEFDYDRNKDEVSIVKLELFDDSLACNAKEAEVSFKIVNTGSKDIDEDDFELKIFNTDIDVNEVFQPEDELKFDDEDDAIFADTVYIPLSGDLEANQYSLEVYIQVDGDIEARERLYFDIEECKTIEKPIVIEQPKNEIKNPITIVPEVVDPIVENPMEGETTEDSIGKDDEAYLILLSIGCIVLFVAVIILIVVLATNKKH